jgi:AAA+ superfamily predicted ATPase
VTDEETARPALIDEVGALAMVLRKLVDEHRGSPGGPVPATFMADADVDRALDAVSHLALDRSTRPGSAPLDDLVAVHGLSPVERTALVAAVAPELSVDIARLYAYLQDDATAGSLTVGLALALTGRTTWDADARASFLPDGAMPRAGIVSVSTAEPFPQRRVVVPDRVAQHLLGDDRLPPAVQRCLAPAVGVEHPSADQLRNLFDADEWFVYLRSQGDGADAIAVHALQSAGVDVLHIDLRRADDTAAEVIALASREASLQHSALVIGPIDVLPTPHRHTLDVLGSAAVPVVAHGRSGWGPAWSLHPPAILDVPTLDLQHRVTTWQEATAAAGLDVDPTRAATTYQLAPADIVRSVHAATLHARAHDTPVDAVALAHGVRGQNAVQLERLARRISPRATNADLVLAEPARGELEELVAWVENRDRLIDEWGLRGQGTKGRGIAGLFVGSSGTGKTLAAEVVAGQLGLDLYVVDLSTVVSKYIGETEENLERVFQEATGVNGVLFFDEADALFGKRTGVSDSKDRFANMEVAYLLQRMEQFDGLSLLASNLRANLDEAFTRRLDFVITFPDPPPAERERIWDLHLPPAMPRDDDLDLAEIARRFDLAGGAIANVARAAGHAALRADEPVGMRHLVKAVAREYAKLGRLVRRDEFGELAELLDR